MAVIEVNQLSFRYPQANFDAIHDLNFKVEKGEFFCVVGSSGSGKSTLCHALVGLIPHYFLGKINGTVNILERELTQLSLAEISQRAGLVFQDPYNQLSYTAETVEEELAYGLENRGIPRLEIQKCIMDVAIKLGLEDILKLSPLSLSGGQVQRVAVGCSVILNPEVLVLDECTNQLDPEGINMIFKLIRQLNNEGITVVMVDNNVERIAEYADHILLMKDGKSVALGTAQEVFSQLNIANYDVGIPEYLSLTQEMVSQKLLSTSQVTLRETISEIRRHL
ncbi:energy-coupling factor ABC transporter ATP-binding protein [Latilactobacillus fuchuensis]|uniref:ABC transporter, ATP-binding protein n=1 Tax=Latilactobacillus fuchuensis DSM 14340 = JCM 11249 TaxID=1423747 RepID=A0A0R1RYT3_9LACO|nr:ABC transporter ATP-binding protein [Latilactobacillus fuchuensis]KRL59205.1 ABC transporter, ATP-binding protein [Latilactobacillus fuchuensis DSM 14340 = JCM 11249]